MPIPLSQTIVKNITQIHLEAPVIETRWVNDNLVLDRIVVRYNFGGELIDLVINQASLPSFNVLALGTEIKALMKSDAETEAVINV